jgi:hypothetical protein
MYRLKAILLVTEDLSINIADHQLILGFKPVPQETVDSKDE